MRKIRSKRAISPLPFWYGTYGAAPHHASMAALAADPDSRPPRRMNKSLSACTGRALGDIGLVARGRPARFSLAVPGGESNGRFRRIVGVRALPSDQPVCLPVG